MSEVSLARVIAIVGGGSIGVAFAVTFARAGWRVRVFDPDAARRNAIHEEVIERLAELVRFELIDEAPAHVAARVEVVDSIEAAVVEADIVEECAPERVELKRDLFRQIDRFAPASAILASASSFLTASKFIDPALPGRDRCLVAHPGNPPYLIPLVEIVPGPFTSAETTTRAMTLFDSVGLNPVLVAKEVEGFVFNRLQGAVLREAYCLVRDGVASVEDIDTVMREALGLRWSVIGPFETVDLNTRGGIAAHAERMGPSYARMGAERGQDDRWTDSLVAEVEKQRRSVLPLEDWEQRVAWRDRSLMALARNRKRVNANTKDSR